MLTVPSGVTCSLPPLFLPEQVFRPRTLAQLSGMGAHVDTFLLETHHHLTEDALNCSNKNQHILNPYRADQADKRHFI